MPQTITISALISFLELEQQLELIRKYNPNITVIIVDKKDKLTEFLIQKHKKLGTNII